MQRVPNRILRDGILTSERVNSLDWEAEVFYRRLMSVVDDFGRFSAHTALLRAALYPLKLEAVREATVERLISQCEKARLVRLYDANGKRFLELVDFKQQQRAKESKYPNPPPDDGQVHSTCTADAAQVIANAHLDVDGVVVVDELKALSGKPDLPPLNGKKSEALEVLSFLNEKAGRAYRPTETNLRFIAARLKQGATVVDCKQVIAKKCREWKGSDMEQFLRPATLFNDTKFNQYVGELVPIGGTNA